MRGLDPRWWAPIAVASAANPAYATQYLTVAQAQKLLFPQAGEFMATGQPNAWAARGAAGPLGHFFVDEVIGKHEKITYAVAISPDGAVRGVEILDYREPRGGEVRDAAWRAQFLGKKKGAPLAVDVDIQNISGATLSCRHIAEGVRRLLDLHAAKFQGR